MRRRTVTGRLIDRPASPRRISASDARLGTAITPPPHPTGEPTDIVHARPLRPESRQTDQRRLTAAFLSGVLPGLGQALNGRRRLAAVLAIPTVVLIGLGWLLLQLSSPTMLLAHAIVPATLGVLLVLNVLVLLWRLVAVIQAFVDRRYPRRTGRLGGIGLVAVVAFVALPHVLAYGYGSTALSTFGQVFGGAAGSATGGPDDDPGSTAGPRPDPGERINILLMGIDAGTKRTQALTDSLIVVSLDPVGRTVSMVSIPRDLVDVPLGNGNSYAPKINSLLGYANRHTDDFPNGGTRALEDAISTLLGIPIHYYAKVELAGFVTMVDAVGGVDISVARPLSDPKYGGFGVGPGWSIKAGRHHLDGANALAYARIRRSAGENDFTRAERQQQVLVAMRDRAVAGGNFLFSLPRLLEAVGDTVRTDLPPERLPELAALAEEIGSDRTTRAVLTSPMVKSGGKNHPYGSVVIPVRSRIAEMVAVLFTEPGTPPGPWPTPKPSKAAAP
jgi:LCP family protein required for cell wall assembly